MGGAGPTIPDMIGVGLINYPPLYLQFVFERCFELKEEKIESKIWNPKSRSGASEEVGQLSQKGKAATFTKLIFFGKRSSREQKAKGRKDGIFVSEIIFKCEIMGTLQS